MRNPLTAIIAALTEAWGEIRVHKTRVIVSLIGVVVAVASLTTISALQSLQQQVQREETERAAGRPATLYFSAYSIGSAGLDTAALDEAFDLAVERYGVSHASRNGGTNSRVQLADGVWDVNTIVVDPDFEAIHRLRIIEGRWFTEADETALAPRVVINESVWERLGKPDLDSSPVPLRIEGSRPYEAVVVGVTPRSAYEDASWLTMYLPYASYQRVAPPEEAQWFQPGLEIWVPEEPSAELMERFRAELQAALGDEAVVDAWRQDSAAWGGDAQNVVQWIAIGISALVLFLGALGLINVALVTVQQRIREIGVRRAVGASAGRIFFVVLMENLVATALAGVAGVMIAIGLVNSSWLQGAIAPNLTDTPPFPLDIALLGFLAATGVGAIAGLIPALVAVRVRVIDAIRY